MTKKGMRQKDLADCLGMREPEISFMLNRELAPEEKDAIIKKIDNYKKGE